MSDLFAFYLDLFVLLAIGDEEGVNCEDDDSLYQQGDKGKQPLGCIYFIILNMSCLV
jgi:hypothetical protein